MGNPNWKKGVVTNPLGRPKGATNQVVFETRSFFNAFIEHNADEVQKLWDKAKKESPIRALELLFAAAKLSLPKDLDKGNMINVQVINFQNVKPSMGQIQEPIRTIQEGSSPDQRV